MASVVWVLVHGSRRLYALGLLALAGCSFQVSFEGSEYSCAGSSACPGGYECVSKRCVLIGSDDGGDGPDAGGDTADADLDPLTQAWRDDSAADFSGSADRLFVAPRGALEPLAYHTGALLLRASDTATIGDPATTSWADVLALPLTGTTALARGTDLRWGQTDTPSGVGLTDGDSWTLLFEGEVYLDAGAWTFDLDVDNDGFLEVADADGEFRRIASANLGSAGGGFTALASGWYGIRFAFSDNTSGAFVRVRFQGPGVGSLTAIPRHRLRTRADQLTGLVHHGFTDQLLLGDCTSNIDQVAPASFSAARPVDLGIFSDDRFSQRWSGQLRVEVGGDYRFRLDSDDGQRVWIDGVPWIDRWDLSVHDELTPSLPLAPGWHDLVIDHSDNVGAARALFTVESGPDLVGQPLPVDRLRPVEARAERFESGVNRGDGGIPDGGSGAVLVSDITLIAPPGAETTGIDVSYQFDHTYPEDLEFRLIAPSGRSLVLRSHAGGSNDAVNERNLFHTDALNGEPVAGRWLLRVSDNVQQDVGTLRDFELTVHHAAGEAPVETLAVYESPLRDLGQVISLDRVTWDATTPPGTRVDVRLRSCAELADCADAPWSAPLPDPAGSAPGVTATRHLQYRVELVSDGDGAASLENIQIDYTIAP